MSRFLGSMLAGLIVSGCGFQSVLPGLVDPACQAHANPADCQAALDVAMDGLELERFAISVQPISCSDGQCRTWVSALPDAEDCLPSYDVEVARPMSAGSWTVAMSTHGDPRCAFEP